MAVTAFDVLWLLTALPGLAVLRRVQPDWLERGAFAALACSYLVTFALLSPLAIAGYAFAWPIRVLALALLTAIPLAAVDLLRAARGLRSWPRPSLLGLIVLAMVIVDSLASRQAGSHWSGDAHYHISKVRLLIDHGFVHWDPYSPERAFDPIYHSNLYHALIGAWAEYAGLRPFDAWLRMLPWAKLLVAGSAEALAFALCRSRPLALGAAAAAVLGWFPLTILPYPNQLAALWLLPLAFASAVELLAGDRPWRSALGIAAAALVLAQMHGLYYAFAAMLLAPALLAALLFALARPKLRRWARAPALGLIALCVGLPWLATSALARRAENDRATRAKDMAEARAAAAAPVAELAVDAAVEPAPDPSLELVLEEERADEPAEGDWRAGDWRYRGFELLPDGQVVLGFGSLDHGNIRFQLVVALLLLAALTRGQRAVLAFAGIAGTTLAVLHVPLLCTLATRAAGSPWILRRLDSIVITLAFVVVPCALGMLLRDRGWLRGPVPHLMFALALGYAYAMPTGSATWSREHYLAKVRDPARMHREAQSQARRAALLEAHVTPGAVVVSSVARAIEIPQLCDCFPFALSTRAGTHGIPEMAARREALPLLLSHRTERPVRLSLLKQWDVHFLLADALRGGNALTRKLGKINRLTVAVGRARRDILIVVDPARPKRKRR